MSTQDQPAHVTSHQQAHSEDSDDSSQDNLDEIAGTKCRIPYSHDWGPISYQNAMVLHAEPIESEGELQVSYLRAVRPCV